MNCADLEAVQEHAMRLVACARGCWLCPPCSSRNAAGVRGTACATGNASPVSNDETSLRKAIADYRQAVDHGDVESIAAYWAPDADYVDHLGHAYKIQAAIVAVEEPTRRRWPHFRAFAKDRNACHSLCYRRRGVRRRRHPANGIDGRSPCRRDAHLAVWVKRDGRWLSTACASPYIEPRRRPTISMTWRG